MNVKKYLISSFLVFFIFGLIDFLFDFFILTPINKSLINVWRTEIIFWLEPTLYFVAALLFVYIFILAYKGKGIAEGITIGILIGLLVSGIHAFRQYAIYPLPLILVVFWFIEGLTQYIIAGIIVSLIYKSKK